MANDDIPELGALSQNMGPNFVFSLFNIVVFIAPSQLLS